MCKLGKYITFLVFAIMAGGHGYRYYMDISVMFGDFAVPVMWSLPAALFFAFMAVWVMYGYKCSCKFCK